MGETKGVGNTKKRTTPEQAPTAVFEGAALAVFCGKSFLYK